MNSKLKRYLAGSSTILGLGLPIPLVTADIPCHEENFTLRNRGYCQPHTHHDPPNNSQSGSYQAPYTDAGTFTPVSGAFGRINAFETGRSKSYNALNDSTQNYPYDRYSYDAISYSLSTPMPSGVQTFIIARGSPDKFEDIYIRIERDNSKSITVKTIQQTRKSAYILTPGKDNIA